MWGGAGGACAGPPYSQGKASERVTNADTDTVSLTIALLTSSAISSILVLICRVHILGLRRALHTPPVAPVLESQLRRPFGAVFFWGASVVMALLTSSAIS